MQQVFVGNVPVFAEAFLKANTQGVQNTIPVQQNSVPTTGRGSFGAHGPGKKQCPACNRVVGARKMTCDCGHIFIKGQNKAQNVPKNSVPQNDVPVPLVMTPSIDQTRWISLGKGHLANWVGVNGIALSDNDTGYTIASITPFILSKDGQNVQKNQAEAYIERNRLDAKMLAKLS